MKGQEWWHLVGEFIDIRGHPAVSVGILGLTKVYLIFNEICEYSWLKLCHFCWTGRCPKESGYPESVVKKTSECGFFRNFSANQILIPANQTLIFPTEDWYSFRFDNRSSPTLTSVSFGHLIPSFCTVASCPPTHSKSHPSQYRKRELRAFLVCHLLTTWWSGNRRHRRNQHAGNQAQT